MSLHALDALNRQHDAQQYVAPIEPDLAPQQLPTPERPAHPGFLAKVAHVAQVAIGKFAA